MSKHKASRRVLDTTNIFKVLVIGSIHLDIISEATSFSDTLDKPGTLSLEIGGTAYNVASNFATLPDVQVSFLSAVRDSEISQIYVSALEQNKIQSKIIFDASLSHSGFNAHLDNGQMTSAISAIAVEQYLFEDTPNIRDSFQEIDLVVLDCNLSTTSIKNLSRLCLSLNLTYVLCAVSESKVLRSKAALNPSLIAMNSAEHTYLQESFWDDPEKQQVFNEVPQLVTFGEDGLHFKHRTVKLHLAAEHLAESVHANTLGAGDAACCGFAYAYFLKQASICEALHFARALATQVLKSTTCNLCASDLLNFHISELSRAASYDALTGLLKRDAGLRKLQVAFERAKLFQENFCVLFLDIDFFKKINDNYSHAAGDLALKRVAECVRNSLRDELDFVIRWGGEEFVAVLTQLTFEAAEVSAERIRTNVEALLFPEYGFVLTISGGLVSYAQQDMDAMLNEADMRMYTAKKSGRNQICSSTTNVSDGVV